MRAVLRSIVENGLDYGFPRRCGLCGQAAEFALCPQCDAELLPPPEVMFPGLDAFAAVTSYEGRGGQAVRRLKYERVTGLAEPMGRRMGDLLANLPDPGWPTAGLVPIPIHWRRLWERGFNQSELLAAAMVESLRSTRLASASYALRRARYSTPQAKLNAARRRQSIAGAFELRRTPVQAILIDDTATTGSTLVEAAETLRRGGCQWVGALTFAYEP